jgi:hypothetical protein
MDLACRVESTTEGHLTRTLLECPLHSLVVDDAQCVKIVFGKHVLDIIKLFGLLKSTKKVVGLPNSNDSVSRAGRGYVTSLFDLLPSDGGRLNRRSFTIQTMRNKKMINMSQNRV